MNTFVDDRHIYHRDIPEGRQANNRFSHRTDWFYHCSLCTSDLAAQLEELE